MPPNPGTLMPFLQCNLVPTFLMIQARRLSPVAGQSLGLVAAQADKELVAGVVDNKSTLRRKGLSQFSRQI